MDQTQTRLMGEQEVVRELRIENAKLREDLNSLQSSSDSQKAKIEDLRYTKFKQIIIISTI